MPVTTRREIILIHGMGCGGDIWAPMQASLEAQGWRCSAPTLMAKQRPVVRPVPNLAPNIRLADYVSDARGHCEAVTARTGLKPIIIGHSMGGLIAQALACEGACSAAIFVTPAPPAAITNRSLWAMVLYANVLLSGKLERYHKAWRFGVFNVLLNNVPKRSHAEIYAAMRYEPGQVFADMVTGLALERDSLNVPALFISAGRDRIVPHHVVAETAHYYQAAGGHSTLHHYPEHGHWIIDEPGNEAVMTDMTKWLGTTVEMWGRSSTDDRTQGDKERTQM